MNTPNTERWGRALALGTLLMGSLLGGVSASSPETTGQLPEILKEIKPAAGVCRSDEVLPGADGILTVPEVQPDLNCAISVSEVRTLLTQPSTALIDLRLAADYQAFHIEGALNLGFSDLHSKPYWRNKTVVLIGNGKAERELYSECAQLKRSGYKQVRVLRGGMPLWLVHNQPVMGRLPSVPQLARLPASEFWLESKNPDNLVVLSKGQGALQGDLSFSVVLPQTTGEAIKAVIKRRHKELKSAPLASVILAADPTVTDEQIQQLQSAIMPVPLLVYADTRDAFMRQLVVQKAIWLAQARGPKQPGCGL